MGNYFEDTAAHIARLYQTPGWRAWARQWARELEEHPSGAFKGLVEAVRSRLASLSDQQKTGG
jgi:hypothetical protein